MISNYYQLIKQLNFPTDLYNDYLVKKKVNRSSRISLMTSATKTMTSHIRYLRDKFTKKALKKAKKAEKKARRRARRNAERAREELREEYI